MWCCSYLALATYGSSNVVSHVESFVLFIIIIIIIIIIVVNHHYYHQCLL